MIDDANKPDHAALKITQELDTLARRRRRRERALKSVAVLPSLATLGNLVCGFGAIYLCLLSVQANGVEFPIQVSGRARLVSRRFPLSTMHAASGRAGNTPRPFRCISNQAIMVGVSCAIQ